MCTVMVDGGDKIEKQSLKSVKSERQSAIREFTIARFFDYTNVDHDRLLKQFFLPCLTIHRYSGCYLPSSWREDGSKLLYCARIVFIALVITLNSYQIAYLGYYLISLHEYNNSVPVTITLFAWSLQSLAALVFLIVWQRKQTFERLFKMIHLPQKSTGVLQSIPAIRIVRCVALVLMIVDVSWFSVSALQSIGLYEATLPNELFNMYGEKLQFLAITVIAYTAFFWIISLTLYVNVTICGKQEFEYFNDRLRKIGEETRDKICDTLLQYFMTHRELANIVREMDRAFQVYTFIMIGTNVPAMTFSLLSVVTAQNNSMLLGLSAVSFCIVQLISLTAVPAKLHSRIIEAERIIYNCREIWFPHDTRLYTLASSFISHANQHNLGVSVWGFAVVTKPLLLTTISLTATYLAFVVQMKSSCDCSAEDNTADVSPIFNVIF